MFQTFHLHVKSAVFSTVSFFSLNFSVFFYFLVSLLFVHRPRTSEEWKTLTVHACPFSSEIQIPSQNGHKSNTLAQSSTKRKKIQAKFYDCTFPCICRLKPSSSFLFFPFSFKVVNGTNCEDINECEDPGSCSQICTNEIGGFKVRILFPVLFFSSSLCPFNLLEYYMEIWAFHSGADTHADTHINLKFSFIHHDMVMYVVVVISLHTLKSTLKRMKNSFLK